MESSPMVSALFTQRRPNPGLPLRRARGIAEGFAPLLLLYVMYTLVRWLVADRGPVVGFSNAHRILDLETRLDLDWETGIQSAAMAYLPLIKAANWYYVAGFLPVLILSAVLAAHRAKPAFLAWRRVFAISLLIALTGFAFFPLTPPRMLPADHGFVDTLMLFGPRYYGDVHGASLFNAYGSVPSTVNVYAAMPSMHVAWSVIAGILFAAAFRNRVWAVALGTLHPMLMAVAVILTANHYVLDVLIGLAVLLVSILLARLRLPLNLRLSPMPQV